MHENPDHDAGPEIWAVTDAVFAGRAVRWEAASDMTPPAHQPVLRELRRIAKIIAAHEERHDASGESELDREPAEATWGPLVILEKIGEGAFGDVFRAREPRLDRQVALKFFRPHRLSSAQLTSDVIEEGRLLARVHHPNVVTVYGAEHLDERFGIWMEFVEGTTLEEIVAEQGPLNAAEAMAIGRDLCGALTALHAAGVIHRDIKARNVMREQSGRVVLMDLGISCEIDHEVPVRQYGTPLYAAPEVLLAGESSPQGDIYSLGVLLYFLVSGRYPVTGSTLAAIHTAHEAGQVESLAAVRPDLPAAFLRIVDKALAANRDERYATAAEFEQALDDALSAGASTRDGEARASSLTDNREAYNHYLQGRHFWNRRYRDGLPRAMEFFRQALACDPNFALAHVGFADCLNLLSYHQYLRPREGFAKAREAAEKALELDPGLGEVQATFGWTCMFDDWDFAAAERHFRRAIQLCPQYGLARQWYALMLASRGRDEEAMAEIVACRSLDPASLVFAPEAVVLLFAGRHQEAIQMYRLALETDPESWFHNTNLSLALFYEGETEQAETLLRNAIRFSRGEAVYAVSLLGFTLGQSGREDEALEQIAHLEALARTRYVSYYHRMGPWYGLGRYDKWGPLLDKAIEERDPFLVWVRPGVVVYDTWLADSRFADPLRRVGLVD